MLKALGMCVVCAAVLVNIFVPAVGAQNAEFSGETEENSLVVVEEALDQIEKDLGLAGEAEGPHAVLEYGLEPVEGVPVETNLHDEILESEQEDEIVPLESVEIFLPDEKADDSAEGLEESLIEDEPTASPETFAEDVVIAQTPPELEELAEEVLDEVEDYTDTDILFEAKTLQIILNDEHLNGVDWEAIVFDYQKLVLFDAIEGEAERRLSLGTVSREDYAILLEALDTVGAVRTVAEEDIAIRNETVAAIGNSSLSSTDEGVDSRQAELKQALTFHLGPVIKEDGLVELSISPEIAPKSLKGSGSMLKKNMLVEAQDGATIIIGSLFEEVMVASTWKVPLLGDLPLLGFVFRNQGEELRTAEVITFLTLKIDKDRTTNIYE